MTAWGKRNKVRLHSGGISPSQVRLSRRGASEKGTAPGRDIRDIGPDRGPRRCRVCSKPVETPGRARCRACISDESVVRLVRRELKSQGLPPLGAPVPDGAPYAKKRRQAEAALKRIRDRTHSGNKAKARPAGRVGQPVGTTCPKCFVILPASGRCDTCAH